MESIGPERWEKKDEDESRFLPFYHVTQHVKVNGLNGRGNDLRRETSIFDLTFMQLGWERQPLSKMRIATTFPSRLSLMKNDIQWLYSYFCC